MYRYGFTALEGVEGVKGVVGTVGKVIDRLTLPAREKRQLEAELLELLVEHEQEMARSRSAAVVEEARGNWLQRSWRPLVMLVFALIVLVGTFTTLPLLSGIYWKSAWVVTWLDEVEKKWLRPFLD